MKDKVLITCFPLESNFGGGEKVTVMLAKEFRKNIIETEFWGSCPVFLEEFHRHNFPTVKALLVRDITSVKSLLMLPVYLLSLFLQSLFVLPYYRLCGTKKIIMLSLIEQVFLTIPVKIMGFDVFWWHHLPPGRSLMKNPFFRFWKCCSLFATLIVSSKFVKDEFAKMGKMKIEIVSNAVDFSLPSIGRAGSEHKKNKKLRVGMLCRLSHEKGIFEFLRLAKDFPQYDFLIAGKGDLRSEIEAYIRKHDLKNVNLVGFVSPEKADKYLDSLDIICVFSKYESFGIVAAEASFVGKPVLASRVCALPEVVLDEETGLLFEYGNFSDLHTKFLQLADDPELRKRLGRAGTKYVQENFLPEHLFNRMYGIVFRD